ncbi:hypothetical protein ACFORG_13420 [Lutimaribacter marinistellae]|uniref:Uncharacterized protein n=1 Tax=Lutimaribacter marinistellae TaxID=1820329 RepID=A0ABV7TGN6_9RHOB
MKAKNCDDLGYHANVSEFFFDVMLAKNGAIIGRSNATNPKRNGYFKELLYSNVIQDTGGTDISQLVVLVNFSNYAEDWYECVHYSFQDPPRKHEGQLRNHYIKVCNLFVPFLEASEKQLRSNSYSGRGAFAVTNWDRGTDEEVIGASVSSFRVKVPPFI